METKTDDPFRLLVKDAERNAFKAAVHLRRQEPPAYHACSVHTLNDGRQLVTPSTERRDILEDCYRTVTNTGMRGWNLRILPGYFVSRDGKLMMKWSGGKIGNYATRISLRNLETVQLLVPNNEMTAIGDEIRGLAALL